MSSELEDKNEQIKTLQASIDFKRKSGSMYSNLIVSMNKLKAERREIIAGAESQGLQNELVYLTNKFESLKEEKHSLDAKCNEVNRVYNYLNKNYPNIFNN